MNVAWLCPLETMIGIAMLNRPTSCSPLASKHCDSQYFPNTTSILSPCRHTNRHLFWGPGWLLTLRGCKHRKVISGGMWESRHVLVPGDWALEQALLMYNVTWPVCKIGGSRTHPTDPKLFWGADEMNFRCFAKQEGLWKWYYHCYCCC